MAYGLKGLEVTEEVFDRPTLLFSMKQKTGCTPLKRYGSNSRRLTLTGMRRRVAYAVIMEITLWVNSNFPPLIPSCRADCVSCGNDLDCTCGKISVVTNAALGKEVPVAGTYAPVRHNHRVLRLSC